MLLQVPHGYITLNFDFEIRFMGELRQICTVPSVTLFNFSCSLGPATQIVTIQDQKFLKIDQNDTTFTFINYMLDV